MINIYIKKIYFGNWTMWLQIIQRKKSINITKNKQTKKNMASNRVISSNLLSTSIGLDCPIMTGWTSTPPPPRPGTWCSSNCEWLDDVETGKVILDVDLGTLEDDVTLCLI